MASDGLKNSKDNTPPASQASTGTATVTVSGRQQVEPNTDYRVVVFGSAGVGKSSLVLRFVRGTFKDSYVPTIEDTYRQVITSNKMVCTLQITDTTGSHQFPAMQRLNIQKGHAFILVYSITSRQSLEELKAIYKDIKDIKGASEMRNVPMMLVGSKCDETSSREVSEVAIEKLAQDWNCSHIETSAKNNLNVKEAFQQLLSMDTRYNMTLDSNGKSNSDKLSSQSSLAKNAVKPKNAKKEKAAKGEKNSGGGEQPSEPGKRKCVVM